MSEILSSTFLELNGLGRWKMMCIKSTKHPTFVHKCLLFETKKDIMPLVRIHSECFTGDVLSSAFCDCGEQLHRSLEMINNRGYGLLIFPANQEGRGIGLVNKLKAYKLIQEDGLDTYEANRVLGFEDDLREYSECVEIVKMFFQKIDLLTTNPEKIKAFGEITNEVIPLIINSNIHNQKYLESKSAKHMSMNIKKETLNFMEGFPDKSDIETLNVCIIRASWHQALLKQKEENIIKYLREYGVKNIKQHVVPGCVELLRATHVLKDPNTIYIWLGVLIKGDTLHFEMSSKIVTDGFVNFQSTGTNIIQGVLFCNNIKEAKDRCYSDELAKSLAITTIFMGSKYFL